MRMREQATDLTIVVPIYKEAENICFLTERIFRVTASANISAELIFVDDDSQDGTEAICNMLAPKYNVRLIVRKGVRGLATAVIDGLKEARGRFLLSMDSDLSHPPAVIPEMFRMLNQGADFVVGSRYVTGGCVQQGWGLHRWLNSMVATLMARPLTCVTDPLSGFFALPRTTFLKSPELSPIGYKVGLELLVKIAPQNIIELPISYENRKFGKSKLSPRIQIQYVRHLWRLYRYRYPSLSEVVQFSLRGNLSLLVDLRVYSRLQSLFRVNYLAGIVNLFARIGYITKSQRGGEKDDPPAPSRRRGWRTKR
jgi:dolichol-phosphate mannosyltransferase